MRVLVAALAGALSIFSFASQSFSAPAYDWSGIYAGVGGGYAWGSRHWHYDAGTEPHPNPQSISGVIAGGHAVAQAQWGALVVGAEAEALATSNLGVTAVCPSATFSCAFTMPWVFTVAPRVGVAMGNFMAYGTAGYAGAQMTTTATFVSGGALLEQGTRWHNGWVAGGGVDWAYGPNVTLGVQYLHVDLDKAEHVITVHAGENHAVSAAFDTVMARASFGFR